MRKYLYTLVIGSFWIGVAAAQDNKIKTDRPSQTQSAETVGKKTFQVETGLRLEQQQSEEYIFEHPQLLARIGLAPKLEFRAEITPQTQKVVGEQVTGLKPIELGLKLGLLEGHGFIPQTTLQAHVGMADLSSDEFRTPHYYPRVRMLFKNKLSEKVELGYNVGAEWDGESSTPDWIYTLSPQFQVTDKLELFIEEFAFIRNGGLPEHQLDGGLAYYLGDNVKWDLWGGVGLNDAAPNYFVSTGISFRLKK